MSADTEFTAPRSAQIAGTCLVGLALLFLSRFADTVMAELAGEIVGGGEAWRYRGLSTLWVLGGLLGALGAAMRFRLEVWRGNLSWSLRACSAGWLLTTLTTGMRASVGTLRLGLVVGSGYLLSNVLGEGAVFVAGWFGDPIKGGGVVVAFLMAAGSILAPFLTPQEPSMAMEPTYQGRGLLVQWVTLSTITLGVYALSSGPELSGLWQAGVWTAALLLGLWLDARPGRWPVGIALAIVALALSGLLPPMLAGGLGLLAGTLTTVIAIYFAARGGRVWVAAGTMAVVIFLAPYGGSWIAG